MDLLTFLLVEFCSSIWYADSTDDLSADRWVLQTIYLELT
jgi:hypothetical protein